MHVDHQSERDRCMARSQTAAGFLHVDSPWVAVIALDVRSPLANNEAADIMAIASANPCYAITVVQQGKPAAKCLHHVRTQSPRVEHFERIEGKFRSAQVFA